MGGAEDWQADTAVYPASTRTEHRFLRGRREPPEVIQRARRSAPNY